MTNYVFVFLSCTLLNAVISCRSYSPFKGITQWLCRSSAKEEGTNFEEENEDRTKPRNENPNDDKTTKFRHVTEDDNVRRNLLRRYLVVYLLATFSDWLQGPYVYVLYEAYGFAQHHIAMLFVTGYASSMVFGSFLGGLADEYGRKRFVILYCITYACGCMTKHFNNFNILIIGRVLSGMATSLLFSVFEAWLIGAHASAGLAQPVISSYFSIASYGNSLVAIVAGLISHRIANEKDLHPTSEQGLLNKLNPATDVLGDAVFYRGGFLNPFDLATFSLCMCGIAACFFWEENFGDQRISVHGGIGTSDSESGCADEVVVESRIHRRISCIDQWKRIARTVISNKEILLCCCVSCLFEGSMYVFVFMWTPALTQLAHNSVLPSKDDGAEELDSTNASELPVGIIFSTFMVCCMVGSSVFSIALEKGTSVESLVVVIMVLSSATMLTVACSSSETVAFLAMNVFEVCVGMYFPSMGTLKSAVVPECSRAGVYSMCRVPLNVIVLVALLGQTSVVHSFGLCAAMLLIAGLLQYWLLRSRVTRLPDGVDTKRKVVTADAMDTGAEEYDMVEAEEGRKDTSLLRERKVVVGSSS